jgi:hypothetical protein
MNGPIREISLAEMASSTIVQGFASAAVLYLAR